MVANVSSRLVASTSFRRLVSCCGVGGDTLPASVLKQCHNYINRPSAKVTSSSILSPTGTAGVDESVFVEMVLLSTSPSTLDRLLSFVDKVEELVKRRGRRRDERNEKIEGAVAAANEAMKAANDVATSTLSKQKQKRRNAPLQDVTNATPLHPQSASASASFMTPLKTSNYEPSPSSLTRSDIESELAKRTAVMRSSFTTTLARIDRKTQCRRLKNRISSSLSSTSSSPSPSTSFPVSPSWQPSPSLRSTLKLVQTSLTSNAMFKRRKATPFLLQQSQPGVRQSRRKRVDPIEGFIKKLSSPTFYNLYVSSLPPDLPPSLSIPRFITHLARSDPYHVGVTPVLFRLVCNVVDEDVAVKVLEAIVREEAGSGKSEERRKRNMAVCLKTAVKLDKIKIATYLLPLSSGEHLGPAIDVLVASKINRKDKARLRLLGGLMRTFAKANSTD